MKKQLHLLKRTSRNDGHRQNNVAVAWLLFGSDLLMNYFAGTLRLTRNCINIPAQQHISVRMCDVLRIHYRIIVSTESIDRSMEVGSFKVPKCSFSVHVFYLGCIPGPSAEHYWDNFQKEEETRRRQALKQQ
uniref:Uncharacterized protein n=1 Tax=Ditylenchus dipsaci TaxID=166011 RepID=A0A915EET7_9BILA